MTRALSTLLPAVVLLVAAFGDLRGQSAGDEGLERSVLDGVYTAEQAGRGEEVYEEECSACHARGYFTASTFRRTWDGRALYWLYKQIRTRMPEDNPASLDRDEYADVLAYILRLNDYPAGEEELPEEDDALRLIMMEAPTSPDPSRPD